MKTRQDGAQGAPTRVQTRGGLNHSAGDSAEHMPIVMYARVLCREFGKLVI